MLYVVMQLYLLPAAVGLTILVLALVGWQAFWLAGGQGGVSLLDIIQDPSKFILHHPQIEYVLTHPILERTYRVLIAAGTLGLVLLGNSIFAKRQKGIGPRSLGFRWPPPVVRVGITTFLAIFLNPLSIVPWVLHSHPILAAESQGMHRLPSATDAAITFSYYVLLASAEELIYRGYVLQVLERSWGAAVALPGSALLFSLSHVTREDWTLSSRCNISHSACWSVTYFS